MMVSLVKTTVDFIKATVLSAENRKQKVESRFTPAFCGLRPNNTPKGILVNFVVAGPIHGTQQQQN